MNFLGTCPLVLSYSDLQVMIPTGTSAQVQNMCYHRTHTDSSSTDDKQQ